MRIFIAALVIAFAFIRLVVGVTYVSADSANFQVSAAILARSGNIYVEQFYWNYTPVPGLLLRFAQRDWFMLLMLATFVNAVLIDKIRHVVLR